MLFHRPLRRDWAFVSGATFAGFGFLATGSIHGSLSAALLSAGLWWLLAGVLPALVRRGIPASDRPWGGAAASRGGASLALSEPIVALTELADLHERGALTDAEFSEAKRQVLDRWPSGVEVEPSPPPHGRPGFYPDPLTQGLYERWWDGQGWLDETYPEGGPTVGRETSRDPITGRG